MSNVHFSSKNDAWTTPIELFNKLNLIYNFGLDAAALDTNKLCQQYYGPDHIDPNKRDALTITWPKDKWIWLNPPYGNLISQFLAKAHIEVLTGSRVIALIPSRTDTKYWHDYVMNYEITFIKGRLKFGNGNLGGLGNAPFPSALIKMEITK
jgi:phage N-6-adenine-methyltransferase